MKVLIAVGLQNDFCEGGTLEVIGGASVARAVGEFIASHRGEYDLIVTSQDWHIAGDSNGGHFPPIGVAPDFVNTWPPHCLQGEYGAEFHADFQGALPLVDVQVHAGMGQPGYSAFEGECADGRGSLTQVLRKAASRGQALNDYIDIDVVGIASDYCVAATATDAVGLAGSRRVRILEELTAAVHPETWQSALKPAVQAAGVEVV